MGRREGEEGGGKLLHRGHRRRLMKTSNRCRMAGRGSCDTLMDTIVEGGAKVWLKGASLGGGRTPHSPLHVFSTESGSCIDEPVDPPFAVEMLGSRSVGVEVLGQAEVMR